METLHARISPSFVELDEKRVRYLGGRMSFWGKILKREGLSEAGNLADRLGTLLIELLGNPSEGVWKDIVQTRRRLSDDVSYARELRSMLRILEDVDGEILRPRGFRASADRVLQRYAARQKWEVEVLVRGKRPPHRVKTKVITVSAEDEKTAKAIAAARFRAQGTLWDAGFVRPKQAATTSEVGSKTGITYDASQKQFTAEMSMLRGGFPVTLVNPATGGKRVFRDPKPKRDREGEIISWTLRSRDGLTLFVWND